MSGLVFFAGVTLVLYGTILSRFGDFGGFMAAYLPIIIGTAVLNAVIVQVLVLLFGRLPARGAA